MVQKKDWFKDRGYTHFSNKTPRSTRGKIFSYISNPKNIAKHSFTPLIFKELKQRRYKLSNNNGVLKRSHKKVKKGKVVSNTKIREILYATHIDAHIFSYYTQQLIAPNYENYLDRNPILSNSITAYRKIETDDKLKFKNNVHFAKDVFNEIKQRQNCVALVLDIENFFPSLNHKKLKLAWAKTLGFKTLPKDHYNLFKATTRFSYIKLNDLRTKNGHYDEKKLAHNRKKGKHAFFECTRGLIESEITIYKNQKKDKKGRLKGIPQGLPLSAILANIYMLSFDEAIVNTLTNEYDVYYRRYSDDIILICKKEQIDYVEKFVREQIEKIDLKISFEKTERTLFKISGKRLQCYRINKDNSLKENIPLNYLGFEFYGYQTLLKSKNLAAFYRRMKYTIRRKHKRVEYLKNDNLIDEAPLFKRRIYRLYSFKGVKTRRTLSKRTDFIKDKIKVRYYDKKYRGNYVRYAYRAADDLDAPEIKRQLRNHWKILQKTIKRYNFSNVHKD